MKNALTALLALALLLAACGDGEESETDDATTEASEEGSTEDGDAAVDTDADAHEATEATGAAPADGPNLNGFRYCEILMSVTGDDGSAVTEVWGTPGVDPCDDADWNALDPGELMAENDASSIHMNGPRYFTVDGTVDTAPGSAGVGIAAGGEAETRTFGDVSMVLLATVDGTTTESRPYDPDLVVRTTTWAFGRGTEVYELSDPEGNTYLMQSYARYEDPNLTAEDLPTLGQRLDLPDGWSYGARVLDEDLVVALAPDGAVVVTDELGNSYQRNG